MSDLRLEAVPRHWEGLTPGQRAAAHSAASAIAAMADRPIESRDELGIDTHRHNHVLLFDGARGTGKTTTLMTLLRAYESEFRGLRDGRRSDATKAPIPFPGDSIVIPLSVVETQPLDGQPGVIVNLARRLRATLHRLGIDPDRAEVESRWRDLVDAVAFSTAADPERRGNQSLEDLALDLRYVVDDLQTRFSEFIDALAKEIERRLHRTPFFVLPIDDADLVPAPTFEIIRVLRAFHHPRLAFVLTGDSELFVESLAARARKELDMAAKDSSSDLPIRVAVDVYDRVIPRHQRYEVNATPQRPGEHANGCFCLASNAVIERALDLPRFRRRGGPNTRHEPLKDLLELPGGTPRLVYALPTRLRLFQDLALATQAILAPNDIASSSPQTTERSQHAERSRFLQKVWEIAVETAGLPFADARALSQTVSFVPNSSALRIDGREFTVHATMAVRAELEARDPSRSISFVWSALDGFEVLWGKRELPRRIVDALAFVVDAARCDERTSWVGPPPQPDPTTLTFLASRVPTHDTSMGLLPWPEPPQTFHQAELFSHYWSRLLDTTQEGQARSLRNRLAEDPTLVLDAWWMVHRLVEGAVPSLDDVERTLLFNPQASRQTRFRVMIDHERDQPRYAERHAQRGWLASLGVLSAECFGLVRADDLGRQVVHELLHQVSDLVGAQQVVDQSRAAWAVLQQGAPPTAQGFDPDQLMRLLPVRPEPTDSAEEEAEAGEAERDMLRRVAPPPRSTFIKGPSSLLGYIEPLAARAELLPHVGVWRPFDDVDPQVVLHELLRATHSHPSLQRQPKVDVFGAVHWEKEVTKEQDLLLRLWWDLASDREQTTHSKRGFRVGIAETLRSALVNRSGLPWPYPEAFSALWDHEFFVTQVRFDKPDEELPMRLLVVAANMVDRKPSAVQIDQWPKAASVLLGRRRGEKTYRLEGHPRWRAYTTFRSALVRLALPEMAPSVPEAVQEHIARAAVEGGLYKQSQLQSFRDEQLRRFGAMQAEEKDHVWFRLVGHE